MEHGIYGVGNPVESRIYEIGHPYGEGHPWDWTPWSVSSME